MNDRTPIDPDLKNFFELTVLKTLFEDNFFAFVNGKVGEMTGLELAEQAFSIAHTQGYSDFTVAHRSQLVNALEEVLLSYKDICNKYSVLANRFPDVKFSIIDGFRKYRIFNDGISGGVLKVVTEVRMAHGRTALEMFNEDIIKATVYLIDRYNYNYRMAELEEWNIQNNMVVWKDIIQGNGFLNFILTKDRTIMTPMRVVVSVSTRPMVKPIPAPPTPSPWPDPQPQPLPPSPPTPPPSPYGPAPYYPPHPGPHPGPMPGPTPCPVPGPTPGPQPWPDPYHPHPGPAPMPSPWPEPYPQPGPQPTPIYPPHPTPPPAPVPFWPPPPPPPPVIADCALTRRVVAERTVGGIKKDSVLPAGLTFTVFVEWLLRGDPPEPEQDRDPSGVLVLSQTATSTAAGQLEFTITDLGTALPQTISFYQRNSQTSSVDELVGSVPYTSGQTKYTMPIETFPSDPVEYYALMNYTEQHSSASKVYESNHVTYDPPLAIYFAAVDPDGAAPTANDIVRMEHTDISDAALATGIRVVVPTADCETTIFIAVPMSFRDKIDWFASDGTTHDNPPVPYTVTGVNGQSYAAYKWTAGYSIPQTFILKLKNQ